MQRECNDVAFGELILSTRLKQKRRRYIQSPKSKMSSKRATLELVEVENAPPQEGIAFTTVLQRIARVFTNQYVDSST